MNPHIIKKLLKYQEARKVELQIGITISYLSNDLILWITCEKTKEKTESFVKHFILIFTPNFTKNKNKKKYV